MRTKKTIWTIGIICTVFILLRLPGINAPYHQDEWKNVSASQTIESAGSFFAHPPFQQIFFVAANEIFGNEYMRFLPLLFSVGTVILLFAIVKRRVGNTAAIWATALFSISFYSIFASLMIDVDGAIMPFFMLLAIYGYDNFLITEGQARARWFALLVTALLCGFLVKLSFVLVIGALVLDYLWVCRGVTDVRTRSGLRNFTVVMGVGIGFVLLYTAILFLIQKIYPAFSISFMFEHANQYSEATGRNYIQIAVQGVKALYYISPLVLLMPVWSNRQIFRVTRVFWLYFVCGFLFYFVIFDFSGGALDKYLMFIIVPFCVLGGAVLASVFNGQDISTAIRRYRQSILTGTVLMLIVVGLNFLAHSVVPLYPKTEWFSRVLHGEWNILTPLTGGNGPMGFYISFLFIAACYVISFVLVLAGIRKKNLRSGLAVLLVVIGIGYNAVFAEEFFFGKINGSSANVLEASMEFISSRPSITQVLTFNDAGAYQLSRLGVYAGRFYAAPQFEEGHRSKFAEYRGQYMVIGIPPLYNGFYSDFFSRCDTLFETQSGTIIGRVYSCTQTQL